MFFEHNGTLSGVAIRGTGSRVGKFLQKSRNNLEKNRNKYNFVQLYFRSSQEQLVGQNRFTCAPLENA